MPTEQDIKLLKDINYKRHVGFCKTPVELTAALDIAVSVINYDRKEKELEDKVQDLRSDLEYAKESLKKAKKQKELSFTAFEMLTADYDSVEDLYNALFEPELTEEEKLVKEINDLSKAIMDSFSIGGQ